MNRKLIAIALLAAGLAAQPLVAAAQAPAQKPAPVMMDQDKMGEQMKKMQAQMDRIRQAADPKERERLMQEHMKTMQETMQGMRGMGGPMMGTMGGGMMGGAKGAGPMKPDRRMNMMEQRMDMMQMMMEQMMQHEGMMQSAPAK